MTTSCNDYMRDHLSSHSADSLTSPSCHGHCFPCSSSAPCNNYRYFPRFWDQLYGPLRLGLGTEVRLWSHFEIYLTQEFSSFFGDQYVYVYINIFKNIYACREFIYTYIHIYIYILYVYVCTYIYMYMYVHTYLSICMKYIYMHIYV